MNPAAALPPGVSVNLPGDAPAAGGETAAAIPQVSVSSIYDPNEIINAGTFQIQGMEPDQFFDSVYSPIPDGLSSAPYSLQGLQKITLKAATDWTRQEAVFAMDAVMAQNQVAMIPDRRQVRESCSDVNCGDGRRRTEQRRTR